MSRAFDTINRSKLLAVLECVPGLTDDDRQLIRILLANTSVRVCFNGILTESFTTNIGTPQGDGLSPILFAVYLEAALRELVARSPQRPSNDIKVSLPLNTIYADDVDFISLDKDFLDKILQAVGPVFLEYDLIVNVDKTENIAIGHADQGVDQHAWRNARKLGSLLGVEEDVNRRIQLAYGCFNKLLALWKHPQLVSVEVRLQSYKALVESVLLYNCGTWALTEALAEKLDCFQRKMLRIVLGIKWFDKVPNKELYIRSGMIPIRELVIDARWRLFGHTLRLGDDTPARKAMAYYFHKDLHGRQGRRTTIASVLSDEYEASYGNPIKSLDEYSRVVECAQDRAVWREIVDKIVSNQRELYESNVQHKTELRHARKRMREEQIPTRVNARIRRRVSYFIVG